MTTKSIHILITRAQPWHQGLQALALKALATSSKLLILVGSVNLARDSKNPFTFAERKLMIEASLEATLESYLAHGIEKQVLVLPVDDYPYNNAKWLTEVQEQVKREVSREDKVYLTGYADAQSSHYLRYFPQWQLDLATTAQLGFRASKIRSQYFSGCALDPAQVTPEVLDFLQKFQKAKKAIYYQELREEYRYLQESRAKLTQLPYQLPFVTGEAIVSCCGHVLLIERKTLPGRGLLALPGGMFHEQDASQIDSAIRELKEETRLKVPTPVLKGCIRRVEDFSSPLRSLRWRILSKAVYIVLPDEYELPLVKPADDARKAFWMPISEIIENRARFFEDHFHILATMIGL